MAINNSPASIIGKLFEALSLGTNPTDNGLWPVYIGSEPDTPDDCITLYDTPGRTQGRNQNSGEMIEQYGLQIRLRSSSFSVAEVKIYAIKTSIETVVKRDTVTVDGNSYLVHAITPSSPVGNLEELQAAQEDFFLP